MKNQFPTLTLTAQAVGLALIAMMSALPAASLYAQEAKIEKIEVTGSNIKRVDAEGPLPVTVITRDEIDRSAAATIGDFVRNLTTNTGGSAGDGEFNGAAGGASGVSLRGLGMKSTLVLINGRRMANHAFSRNLQDTFVDINSIPKGAIERIEVLKDGASAIYGSDAIAGVVNFILRKDYQGGVVGLSGGRSTEGGLGERGLNIAVGFGSLAKDKYNIFATADVFTRDMLVLSERKFIGDGDMSRFGSGNGFLSSSAGTWVSVPPQLGFLQGQLVQAPLGAPAVRRAAFNTCLGNGFRQAVVPFAPLVFSSGTVCANTTTPFITAFPETRRIGILTRATIELSPQLTSFTEISFASNESKLISQHQAVTNVTQVFDPATQGSRLFNPTIPVGNASNPFPTAYQLRYTFFDVGPREIKQNTNAYRVMTGLNGAVGVWDWEAAIGNSESKVTEEIRNQVDAIALRQAIVNNSYNFLAPTPAQTAALRISTQRNSISELSFADAKATTTIGKLAGGDIGFAIGLDARREAINDTPDLAAARTGRLLSTASSLTNGSRTVVAAYSEMVLPLSKVFETQIAARFDRYSDFGSALSPKIGAKWIPYNTILVRASYSRGFRAPTLTENTQTTSITTSNVSGQPGGVSVIFTGNPNLKPEKSESTTIGLVWEPVKNFSLSLDWYTIIQRNLVSANGISYIVANPTLFPNDIVRDSTGAITTVFDRYSNIAQVAVEGVDVEGRWQVMSGANGRLTLRAMASYLSEFQQPAAINQPNSEFAGGNGGPRGALPRTKGKLGIDYDYAGFAFTVNGNVTSGYAQRRVILFPTPNPQRRVSSLSTVDLSVAYSGFNNLKLFASVVNAGDKQPPFDANVAFYDTTQYDLRGRYVRLGAEYKFK